MSKVIRASVLVLLLACSAQAGWIQNGVADEPPLPPAAAEQEPTTGGEIQNPRTTDGEIPNSATVIIAEVMRNLLALL